MPRVRAIFLALIFVAAAVARSAAAEQITIRLLNGRTGAPMKDQEVWVWFEKVNPSPLDLKTDTKGGVLFVVEGQQNSFLVAVSEQFVVDCRFAKKEYGDFGKYLYRISDVLESGVIGTNQCGSVPFNPKPGQLVLFIRPFTFWENVRHFFHYPA